MLTNSNTTTNTYTCKLDAFSKVIVILIQHGNSNSNDIDQIPNANPIFLQNVKLSIKLGGVKGKDSPSPANGQSFLSIMLHSL